MNYLKSNLIGIITLLLILTELIIGFSTLALVNIPRALIRTKKLKISLYKLSNWIGEITVLYLKFIMQLMHGKNSIQVFDDNNLS